MKKLLIIAFMLLQLVTFAQKHIFSTPYLATYDGYEWGRYVVGNEDIGVEKDGNGYWISAYLYNQSNTSMVLYCEYRETTSTMYIYRVTKYGTSKHSATPTSNVGLIKSTTKLSSMALGSGGVINCLVFGLGYAYDCN